MNAPDAKREEQITEGRVLGAARRYDIGTEAMYLGGARRYRSKLLDLAGVEPGEKVLDVGCGPGRLVLAACDRVGLQGEAHGIDPSPEMIERAKQNAGKAGLPAKFTIAAAEDLPFEDGRFDVVTSTLVIHHLTGDELKQKAFKEIRRVLKVGGRLLVVDFGVMPPESRGLLARALMSHHGDAGNRSYPEFFKTAGFTDVEAGVAALRVIGFVRGTAG